MDRRETERLIGGDIVLVRGGVDHSLATTPGAPCRPLLEYMEAARVSPRRFVLGERGERSEFFCGAYIFDGDICSRLLALLPETVRLRPAAGSALRATLDLLAREMLDDEPGQQTLLDRLLDVALVQVLREHFGAAGDARRRRGSAPHATPSSARSCAPCTRTRRTAGRSRSWPTAPRSRARRSRAGSRRRWGWRRSPT